MTPEATRPGRRRLSAAPAFVVLSLVLSLGPGAATVRAADSPACRWADAPQTFDPAGFFPAAGETELLALVACLEHPDPDVRDGFAYETLASALRAPLVSQDQVRILRRLLLDRLEHAAADPRGFRGPFAVLVLAEVARFDRLDAVLTAQQRSGLVSAGADYLAALTDFRGFIPGEGWRHGVAHTADLFMQLALNPKLSAQDAGRILDAIAGKVAPAGQAYVFGEPRRLARPVLYLALTDHLDDADWQRWFDALAPGSEDYWETPYHSAAALAAIHNLRAFALEIHLQASESDNPALRRLAPMAVGLLQSLP